MPFDDLQSLIKHLDKRGDLARITEPVSPRLEITEITDRVVKSQGPALLFENPAGYDHPVLTNAFASWSRIRAIFGVEDIDAIGGRFMEFMNIEPPKRLLDKLKLLPKLKDLASVFPRTVKSGPCQEVVQTGDFDLRDLPVLTCWPEDGGPFITLPVVVTEHPETGRRNVGMYRVQVYDDKTAGMHWHVHKTGAEHYRRTKDGRMPVSVAIGPDPITTYCATAPLPPMIDEFLFSGFLRNKPVELVKCVTNDLKVPAASQYVLEGYVVPGETRIEGPFGDHTGYYSPADLYPVFHLTAITRRKNPVYPATIVGVPPMEDKWLGKVTERLFLPLLQTQVPEIVDMNLPVEGCFHNLVLVSIDKTYPGHAQKVMHSLWGMGQMMFSRMIMVFDRDVDVQDLSQVLFHLGGNVDAARDLVTVKGPVDALDHAAPLAHLGTKMGLDCTAKWPEEGYDRGWPELALMDDETKEKIDELWPRLGLDIK